MSSVDELLTVLETSERLVNVLVVRDVVTFIDAGRLVVRRHPERLNSERNEVRELVDDTAKVAQSVSVVVLERSGVDLSERESEGGQL